MADTLPIWFDGFKKIFAENGIELTTRQIAEEVIGDWEGPKKMGIIDSEKFIADLEEEVMDKLNNVKLNTGAFEIMNKIKLNGGKIAVVTASRKRWVKNALRNNNLREIVDVFLGKEDVGFVKPDPEVIFKAVELMVGNPGETIIVGDNGKDIVAGRRAGIDTCLYFPPRYEVYYKKETQLGFGATYVIEDFREMEKFL